MQAPKAHKELIGTNKFAPECNQPPGWTDKEWQRLRKYGLWYKALIAGTIKPITAEQSRFIEYFRNPRTREPEGEHERLWATYLGRLDYVNRDPEFFGLAPRVPKPPRSGPPRLENGDDDAVYFNPRRKRR